MRGTKSLLLTLLIALLAVEVASAATEITWWYENATPQQEEALQKHLITPFNESQNNYVLRVRFDPNLDTTLRTAMLSGSGPDIVMTAGVGYVLPYIKAGHLLPLDSYAKRYGWYDRFIPLMIKLGTYNGHLYALPKTYEAMVLFYNKTLFQANGWSVPKTRAELEQLANKMVAKGITPFAQGNANWRPNNEHYVGVFLNHYAGPENVYKALKGQLPWNAPIFVRAIELLNEYFQKGWFGKDYFSLTNEDFVSLMAAGRAGMSIIGTWGFQWMNDYFGQTGQEWDWAPFPSLADGVPYPLYDLGIGTTLSINASSKNPEGAAAVIDFLTREKRVVVGLNQDWPGEWNLPIVTLRAEDFGKAIDPRYARHMVEVANTVAKGSYGYTTWTFWPPKTEQYIIEGIEQVWLGKITPREYMDQVNKLFQEELAAGAVPPIPDR